MAAPRVHDGHELDAALAPGGLRTLFQPIVDLETSDVIGYEALSRGPAGTPLENPVPLFARARALGRLAELDAACRRQAFRAARETGRLDPLTLFVNIEPEVLDRSPLDDLLTGAQAAPGALRVVFEITERAIAARPAELLRTVEAIRARGWAVALDDVGTDPASLAFMSLLRPEVVKLDLRLIQQRPTRDAAEIMHAVNAYAERSGALLLAEGIETEQHVRTARAFGARFGQGWHFGRPSEGPGVRAGTAAALPSRVLHEAVAPSPFACLPSGTTRRRAGKRLLIELSKHLEEQACAHGRTAILAATFQQADFFTPRTAARYARLVEQTAFVCAIGEDLPVEPIPGVRGAHLDPADPVRGEWDVIVVTPHFAAALLARDLGDEGPDLERTFEYALTYDRTTVTRAACALLERVVPAASRATDLRSAA
jgi:EAL domain-containing protein (putative c-di-GMP-specific phosphodiesterase class I)